MSTTPTFTEFSLVLDGTEHPRGWKRAAFEVFLRGERKIFYPLKQGYYKYLIDGQERFVARSIHDGSEDFIEHQRFTFNPPIVRDEKGERVIPA